MKANQTIYAKAHKQGMRDVNEHPNREPKCPYDESKDLEAYLGWQAGALLAGRKGIQNDN